MLYPFLTSGKGRKKGGEDGPRAYLLTSIVVAVALLVLWFRWFNASMGPDRDNPYNKPVVSLPEVSLNEPGAAMGPGLTPVGVSPTIATTLIPRRFEGSKQLVLSAPTIIAVGVPPSVTPVVVEDLITSSPPGAGVSVTIELGEYWPNANSNWCLTWDMLSGTCVSLTASGAHWQDLEGAAIACPAGWLGGILRLSDGRLVQCVDYGETFICENSVCRVGLLDSEPSPEWVLQQAVLYPALGGVP